MSESIFGSLALKRAPSWPSQPAIEARPVEPAAVPPQAEVQQPVAPTKPALPARSPIQLRDTALIAILETPLFPGETANAGFARKERELGNAFAALSVMEARSLQSRLSNPRPGDALAQAFSRMTSERRTRLINFLADARRREALGRSR